MFPRKQVALLRFHGPRFADHGLDVDVLPEIVAYKHLLQETAKELWRRNHPGRARLPKKFDDELTLKFFKLEPGSTAVPLVREPQLMGMLFADESLTPKGNALNAAELATRAQASRDDNHHPMEWRRGGGANRPGRLAGHLRVTTGR